MLILETRKGYTFSLFLFSITLKVLASTVKRNKWHTEWKKQAFLIDSIIVYTENPKESTKIYLELITEFNKVIYKIYFMLTYYSYALETKILKILFKIKAKIKGLIVNLTKYTRSYDENFEVFTKELREDLKKWGDVIFMD